MRRFNLFNAELPRDDDDPPGYHGACQNVSSELGASELVLKAFDIDPGQSICPYHYEYVEEWLIVLEGTPTLRHPDGQELLEPGDAVSFPAGPRGAHKVSNNGDRPARVIMFSDSREPAVAVYPDSNKIGVWSGNDEDKIMVRRDAGVDYWEGERSAP